jgi:hypothetical protein
MRVWMMRLVDDFKFIIPFLCGLLSLQEKNSLNRISVSMRFILCGFFSYMAYSIFTQLGPLTAGKEEHLISLGFEDPPKLLLVILVVFFGYFALFCSIAAAALFSSLLPK